MRSMISKAALGLLCLFGTPATVLAAEGAYTCAFTDIFECIDTAGCKRVTLDFANLEPVIKFDFDKKVMISDELGADPEDFPLENVKKEGDLFLFHGIGRNELSPRAFSAAISTKTGKLHGGITTGNATLAVVGDCVDGF